MYQYVINDDVIEFFNSQNIVLISTIDDEGRIHSSVKGLASIEKDGIVRIIDLYSNRTLNNLLKDSNISITSVNEATYRGYTLQGRARVIDRDDIEEEILQSWKEKIVQRISSRVVSGVQAGSKSEGHYEAELPMEPAYLIEVEIDNVINLATM